MTRKDYRLIASTLKEAFETAEQIDNRDGVAYFIVRRMCHALADDNPCFDSIRFITACGLEHMEPKRIPYNGRKL